MVSEPKQPLLDYLINAQRNKSAIPSIPEISRDLGISTASTREQLEVARSLGFVRVKPKVGIQPLSFSLRQPLMLGMQYGMKLDPSLFESFLNLRKHLEVAYWYEAVSLLTKQEITKLHSIVDAAYKKIRMVPVQLPEEEHQDFHLLIYSRLENPVVMSILETYWDLYRQSDYSYYINQDYLETVWSFHQQMVEALASREFDKGFEVMKNHLELVQQRKKAELNQRFE